ncbi:Uncharacterised protein [Neisseria animaloris]|uniref:hypothetical protein n=1 Tax=Neisseria animaloris TaxID=326522 RepID=UPI000F6C7BE0|nr:hypothetical protein [Neisseria animaloris]VEH86529.1 Uncharacterised protein [Neisseria animaloris]
MFEKPLYHAVLKYLGDKAGKEERQAVAEGIAAAQRSRAEFERKKELINKEIHDGTARSRGKLPV